MSGCEVEGCPKAHAALGYCWTHYRRFKKHGDVSVRLGRTGKPVKEHCEVPGCSRKHGSNGLCRMHYNRTIHYGIERTPEALREYEVGEALKTLEQWGYGSGESMQADNGELSSELLALAQDFVAYCFNEVGAWGSDDPIAPLYRQAVDAIKKAEGRS